MLSLASAAFRLHHRSEVIHSLHLSTCLRKRRIAPNVTQDAALAILAKLQVLLTNPFRIKHITRYWNVRKMSSRFGELYLWCTCPLFHLECGILWWYVEPNLPPCANTLPPTSCLPVTCARLSVYTVPSQGFFFFQLNATYATDGVGSSLVRTVSPQLTTTRPTVPAQVIGCIVQVTFSANRREVLSVYIWQTRSCWSHYWKVT